MLNNLEPLVFLPPFSNTGITGLRYCPAFAVAKQATLTASVHIGCRDRSPSLSPSSDSDTMALAYCPALYLQNPPP